MEVIEFKNLDEIRAAAKEFLKLVGEHKQFALYGGMGAGKTTFIKELCSLLKVTDVVSSPTFSIINEYYTEDSQRVFHFDFYRIEDIEEVYNIGYEDYFYSSDYCFIEWPELVEELLPDTMVKVNIEATEEGSRRITIHI